MRRTKGDGLAGSGIDGAAHGLRKPMKFFPSPDRSNKRARVGFLRFKGFYSAALLVMAFAHLAASADTFVTRADLVLRSRADENVGEVVAWAKRIKLGDPHKYVLPIIAAKLHFDPNDRDAWDAYRWIMDVDAKKGDRGLYHFSAIFKVRIFFEFEKSLPPDVRAWFEENAGGHLDKFRAGGTENHGIMSRTSGYLFAERFQKGGTGDAETDHLVYFREFLRRECRKLYTIGMGEWDSSTYVAFTATGWLNVFDFAGDPEMKELAWAALDWYATAYAVKYFHGVLAGPEARGFANSPLEANTDVMAWLWWDSLPPNFSVDLADATNVRYSVVAAMSTYRPDPIVTAIARRDVEMPFAVRASKPEYYGTTASNFQHEVLYNTAAFSMGTLYDPTPGDRIKGEIWPQTTVFKLAILTPDDVLVLGAANGFHGHFPVEGRSPYDQYHQSKGAMINVCQVNDPDIGGRAAQRSLLAVPDGLEQVGERDDWLFFQAGETFVAVRPLGDGARWTDLADWTRRITEGRKTGPTIIPGYRWLQTDGALCGWVIDTGTTARHSDAQTFMDDVLQGDRLDLDDFARDQTVTYRSLDGDTLKIRHTGGPGGKPEAWTNGTRIEFRDWPVYESRYVNEPLGAGRLEVNDGRESLTVDFSGDWPTRSRKTLNVENP
jgi:hypothetical protein